MISYQTLQKEIENARVAELADAHGSGPCESNFMGVQVPPPRTTKETSFVYQDKRGFFHVYKGQISPKYDKSAPKQGLERSNGRASPCFLLFTA